jgi:hypothetical protein
MININKVRNTVLFVLNKENRGFITPNEFNSFSDMAQMAIFEDDFHKYAKAILKQNNRMYHSEYSDIPKQLRERIDELTEVGDMSYDLNNMLSVDATDLYRMLNITYKNKYDVEEVSKLEINRVVNNSLIAPSAEYPIYVNIGGKYKVYPSTLLDTDFSATYIRVPKQPKWTYIEIAGNPVYNASAVDRQDFELHQSCEVELITKILGYCGISIREAEVTQAVKAEETYKDQRNGL